VEGRARVLVGVLPALRGDRVLLAPQGQARRQRAALQHGGRVAEDEVDGAGHEALAVQVAERVRVQGVLVPVDAAAVGDGAVGAHAQRHRLVLRWPRRVLHPQVLQDDPVSRHGCTHHSKRKIQIKIK